MVPFTVAAVVAGLLAVVPASPAAATDVVVADEAQYRSALTTLSADNSGPHTITLSADITITGGTDPAYTGSQPLTIDGVAGFDLSGGDTRRVLNSSSTAMVTLTDIRVRNGFSAGSGGAVQAQGPVTVTDAEFTDNTVTGVGSIGGGAIWASGSITVSDAEFIGNSATSTSGLAHGGAIQSTSGVFPVSVTRARFYDNATTGVTNTSGTAVRTNGDLTLTDVIIAGNDADAGTGAVTGSAHGSGVVTVTRAQVYDNTATSDSVVNSAGLSLGSSAAVVTDSTLAFNTASAPTVRASALYGVTATLTNVAVTDNESSGSADPGTAVYASAVLDGHHVTVTGNTGISAANVTALRIDGIGWAIGRPGGGDPNCSVGQSAGATRSVADDTSCFLSVGIGNAEGVADIGLGRLHTNGDLLTDPATPGALDLATPFPLAGSPVLDRVPSGECDPDEDLRGVARPFGSACDAGAIEAVYPGHAFSDVPPWVEDTVRWIASTESGNGIEIMQGFAGGTFRPNASITRAQVVRLLHRLAGQPSGFGAHGLSDVPPWVEEAVRWAVAEGVADGFDDGTFRPNDSITRAQVVRMVHRVAGEPGVGGIDPHGFSDVPPWVETAVRWAANPDLPLPLVAGFAGGLFEPNDPITRAQVARTVYRLALTPAAWADPASAPTTVPFQLFTG